VPTTRNTSVWNQDIIFKLGFFRTDAFSQKKHEPTSISASAEFNKRSIAFEQQAYGNEQGNPKKAIQRMIDVVKEGMARGKPTPPRLPFGTDGLKVMMDKSQATLKICREWEAFTKSTDVTPNDGKWRGRATAIANLSLFLSRNAVLRW
jgi:hypothetical protein